MSETQGLRSEEDGIVALEEEQLQAPEETCDRVLDTPRGESHADESDSVTQPLLQHKYQDSRAENHKAHAPTVTAGADRDASVPPELEFAVRREPGCTGSVRSLCSSSSSSSRRECPICNEQFDRLTLLNCDHALCHTCTAGIMSRAQDPGRLRCPFCRQTTPFPQWEIRRLQEESYSGGVPEAGPALTFSRGPALQAVPASRQQEAQEAQARADTRSCCASSSARGLRLMQRHALYWSFTVLLLLFLTCWATFCLFVPLIILSNSSVMANVSQQGNNIRAQRPLFGVSAT